MSRREYIALGAALAMSALVIPGVPSRAQDIYPKVSFIDLAVDRVIAHPGQKVEMTGNLETELSGSMVFLYNHGLSTRSTSARIFRQIVVTRLPAAGRAYILEHCGGSSGCPATVRGSWSQYGGIIAETINFL